MHSAFFTSRPWVASPFRVAKEPAGMLGADEASLFYHLAKTLFEGRGAIIDAGSFLGKSAFYFAEGLKANPRKLADRHRIHCYDNFIVNELDTVDYLKNQLNTERRVGDSTRDIFDRQVAHVKEQLQVHAGDFHAERWNNGPIEILMVDIAKMESLWSNVMEQMFPHLIPGHSVVIHQDYNHPWLPHIHVAMEYLADYFVLLAPRIDGSAVFGFKQHIPPEVLARAVAYKFSAKEKIDLMRRAIERMPPNDRHFVEQARVCLLAQTDEMDELRRSVEEMERNAERLKLDSAGMKYAREIRDYAQEREGWWHNKNKNWQRSLELANMLLERRGNNTHLAVMKGSALLGLERHAEAEQALRMGTECYPPSGWAFILLSQALRAQKRMGEAADILDRGVIEGTKVGEASARNFCEAYAELWDYARDHARCEASLAKLRPALAAEPEFHVLEAKYLAQIGERGAARRSLLAATQLGLSAERSREIGLQLAL